MDALELYKQVAGEIKREEAELVKKKEFARMLLSRLDGEPGTVDDSSTAAPSPPRLGPPTLRSQVEDIVRSMGTAEFNTTVVFDRLVESGRTELPPKVRITTILGRMADAKDLVIVRKGVGNQPNWYQLASAGSPPHAVLRPIVLPLMKPKQGGDLLSS